MAGGGGGPPIPKRKHKNAGDDDVVEAREPMPIDDEIDFTPMVDIVFLLLIFFMVATKISRSPKVDIPHAFHGKNMVESDFVIVVVRKGSEELAEVTRMDGSKFSPDAEQQEAEIAEYVEAGLQGGLNHVLVKSEGAVKYGEVERVRQAIAAVLEEGHSVHIAVK
ncbi:MAG: biopolymer transporter ExbD [Pirellulales bacterium]